MSIKKFNNLIFLVLTTIMGIIGYFFYDSYNKQYLTERNLDEIVKLNKLILNFQILSTESIFYSKTSSIPKWYSTQKEISTITNKLKNINKRTKLSNTFKRIDNINISILKLFDDYLEIKKDHYTPKDFLETKASHLYSLIIQINKMIFNLKTNELNHLKNIHTDIKYQIFISLFILFLFLLISLLYVYKKVINPINNISNHLENNSDFINIPLFKDKVHNEIDLITSTFNKAILKAKNTLKKEIETKEELKEKNEQLLTLNRELEESEYEIQLINENLEEKIDEKTEKLRILNEKLQEEVEKKTQENFKQFQILQNQSKLASMGEMIGAIAHQWRQPLNELSIRIQSLKYSYMDEEIDENFIQEFIKKNKTTISFMSRTIDDFRNFFRVDKEKMKFSIKAAIEDTINIQAAQLKKHNINIDFTGEDFAIIGLRVEFQHVIMNLIANAKDAFEKNKTVISKINIHLDKNIIYVKDNAGGIPKEVINRIFEPYFTTKEQGKGTGLGLYMSKMIMEENMDGDISVENHEDGATFILKFLENKKDEK